MVFFFAHLIALLHLPLFTAAQCPQYGPTLPAPKAYSRSNELKATQSLFKSQIESTLRSPSSPWNTSSTSFSILVTSPSSTLFEYHHTASLTSQGTKKVDGESRYRVASVTKMMTDLVFLKLGVDMAEKVGKYIPELTSKDSFIDWDEITLDMLASQAAGIPPNYGYEVYPLVEYLEQLGFPKIPKSEFPPCGVVGLSKPCTRKQQIEGLLKVPPVASPGSKPVYSNIAFTLLGYVLEAKYGKPYETIMRETLFSPAGMSKTSFKAGSKSDAVLPPTPNAVQNWENDFGNDNPGGGAYSSPNDLIKLQRLLLSYKFLTKPQFDAWLRPKTFTPGLDRAVGAPWEIIRAKVFEDEYPGRVTDIFIKEGAIPPWNSRFVLIPEFELGFMINAAGDFAATDNLANAVVAHFLPLVEKLGRKQAAVYTGAFSDEKKNATMEISLAADLHKLVPQIDGRGLAINKLWLRGKDMLKAFAEVYTISLSEATSLPPDIAFLFRLYPIGISTTHGKVRKEEWRLTASPYVPDPSKLPEFNSSLPTRNTFDLNDGCLIWSAQDNFYYGGRPVERFVVVWEGDRLLGWEIPALRLTVGKASGKVDNRGAKRVRSQEWLKVRPRFV